MFSRWPRNAKRIMKKLTISFSLEGKTITSSKIESELVMDHASSTDSQVKEDSCSFSDSSSHSELFKPNNGTDHSALLPKPSDISTSPSDSSVKQVSTKTNRKSSKKSEINPEIIKRILNEGSKLSRKRNRDETHPEVPAPIKRSTVEPPCIVYNSTKLGQAIKLPPAIQLNKWLNFGSTPITKPPTLCKVCGAQSKYKEPKSLTPFCSLECLRKIRTIDH